MQPVAKPETELKEAMVVPEPLTEVVITKAEMVETVVPVVEEPEPESAETVVPVDLVDPVVQEIARQREIKTLMAETEVPAVAVLQAVAAAIYI